MIKTLEHIGIAVKNLEEAEILYSTIFGKPPYKREVVESEGVTTSFFKVGNVKIELLAATNDSSPIAKFIEKRGEGIHHLAFESTDLIADLQSKSNAGFEPIHRVPKTGADNKNIAFLHPKSTGGVLIELCQDIKPKE